MATVEGVHEAHAGTLRGTGSVVEGVGGIGAVVLRGRRDDRITALADARREGEMAAIVFGAAVLLGNGTMSRLSASALGGTFWSREHAVARETLRAAAGAQIMVGVGAVALGIIATVGTHPVVLSSVAFLALGASLVLGGTAIGGVLIGEFRR